MEPDLQLTPAPPSIAKQPLWYKDAIIYELHVKSFRDQNEDGIGDFPGLLEKLDYLEELGITTIWLLPFCPSPLKDDGYDIADYLDVQKEYGSLADFRRFLREAHRRGLRVITELIVNHTSDQHPWFQRARRARPGSVWRNYYVWSDTPNKFRDARIIFKDFESSNWGWDPIAQSYYFHRFYFHQPDLNYDSPQVRQEVFRIVDFWFDMGVNGLRLDAIPYLYKREGTNCENLPEVHDFLKKLRSHVNANYPDRVLLAEANQWPEEAAAYFGTGDECHMAFHFPVMPRLFMALGLEDRFPILDVLRHLPPIPETCQWVMFLRNHDELTLEMVTDEERTFMYHSYAKDQRARINLGIRRRLAPLLENSRRKIELLNAILFSLPGTPVVYYGDEIGMGDNYYLGDRDGVRTPMQWSPDRNAGFSRASPQRLDLPVIIEPEYHYEALNVENQNHNASSLLWWMKRMIGMRKRFAAFGSGSIKFLQPNNPKIFAFIRHYHEEIILVVASLSRYPQHVDLDLSEFSGYIPEEMFGGTEFPAIKKEPYVFTCGSYDYFWFVLRKPREKHLERVERTIPEFSIDTEWVNAAESTLLEQLETHLPAYFKTCRWFSGKARVLQRVRILDFVPLRTTRNLVFLLYCEAHYREGRSETYFLPIVFAAHGEAPAVSDGHPQAVIARLRTKDAAGILADAVYSIKVRQRILSLIERGRKIRDEKNFMHFQRAEGFRQVLDGQELPQDSHLLAGEQSNTAVIFGTTFFLKLYRKVEECINPELELFRFLNEKTTFRHIPPYAGSIRWIRKNAAEPIIIGILRGLTVNVRDCWNLTLDELERYYERVLSQDLVATPVEIPPSLFDIDFAKLPKVIDEASGAVFLQLATLFGKRTAELHLALASSAGDPEFDPEPFSILYQRSLYQSMSGLLQRSFTMLKANIKLLSEEAQREAAVVLRAEHEIAGLFKGITERQFVAKKIRIHGDYHLGQILYNGKDITIIDFEGEVARPMHERRLKRSPLQDAAGMVRSFHYAAVGAFFLRSSIRREDVAHLWPWAVSWYHWISATFLKSYFDTVAPAALLPQKLQETEILFTIFLLEKALFEMMYDLSNRLDWVIVPLRGIHHILSFHTVANHGSAAESEGE